MQRLSLLIAVLLTSLALAGCLGDDDVESDDSTPVASDGNTTPQNNTTTDDDPVRPNTAPTAGLTADLTTGEAPLLVTFNLTGEDADGDALTWTLDADDDGTTDFDGNALPRDVTHNYTAAGNYTAVLSVTDGTNSTTTNVTVTVTQAATPPTSTLPEDITISDTITGAWVGVYVAVEDRAHNWSFDGAGVANMTIAVAFDGATTVDLDWTVFSPDGTEVVSRAAFNFPTEVDIPNVGTYAVEEPPHSVTDSALLRQTGDWLIEIYPGSAVEGEYTVHVTFA